MTQIPTVHVRHETREGGVVAFVTIDNARKLNVLNAFLMEGFVAAFADLATQDDLRAVVLTGAGERAFVGGADVDEMAALAGPDDARAFITKVHQCCAAVRDLPVPVIARIGGYCLGAGLELAAACDLRVASESAVFGMPEVRLGIPSVVEAALLPALIGWGRTREMLLLGDTFGAHAALQMGLVGVVAPAEDLDAAVDGCRLAPGRRRARGAAAEGAHPGLGGRADDEGDCAGRGCVCGGVRDGRAGAGDGGVAGWPARGPG